MATFNWYEEVPPAMPLTQGDILVDCPVFDYRVATAPAAPGFDLEQALKVAGGYSRLNLVVMTQACDLAQGKVNHVVLCPLEPLDSFKKRWEQDRSAKGHQPNPKDWKKAQDDLIQGRVWSRSVIHQHLGDGGAVRLAPQVVDFGRVYTLPVALLQSWLVSRGQARSRLLPPYREHLSQAFARFFMRVGLPQDIELP